MGGHAAAVREAGPQRPRDRPPRARHGSYDRVRLHLPLKTRHSLAAPLSRAIFAALLHRSILLAFRLGEHSFVMVELPIGYVEHGCHN